MSTTVENRPQQSRYVIVVDGVDAGHTQYVDRGAQRVFVHTEIDPAFEHRGLANELIEQALTDVRTQGLRFVAVCPFVRRYIGTHHQFDDILDPE